MAEPVPDLPLQEMPEIVSRVLYGTTPAVETPPPPDVNEPFGYFAKVKPHLDLTDYEIEFEPPAFTQLFAPDIPIATAALGGPAYIAQPRCFLGDDQDEEQAEADRAVSTIKRLFSEGVCRGALAAASPPEPTSRQLVKREPVAAPKTKTPVLEMKYTHKVRQDDDGFIWAETYDDAGDLQACYVVDDPAEIEQARLELLKERIENSLQLRHRVEFGDGGIVR